MDSDLEYEIEQIITNKQSLLMIVQGDLDLKLFNNYLSENNHSHFVLSNNLFRRGIVFEDMADIFELEYREAIKHEEPIVVFDIWSPEYAYITAGRKLKFWETLRSMERHFFRSFEKFKGQKAIFGLANDTYNSHQILASPFGCVYSQFYEVYDEVMGNKILKL